MTGKPFDYVASQMMKKSFGILGTVDEKDRSHSTGILYGIAPDPHPFHFYIATEAKYKKTRNIRSNPNVSFVVTFPHFYLRFVPANVVQFQGKADILPLDDPVGVETFQQSRILSMALETEIDAEDLVFIRIVPNKKLFVHGLGIGIMEMRKDPTVGRYNVEIPDNRR